MSMNTSHAKRNWVIVVVIIVIIAAISYCLNSNRTTKTEPKPFIASEIGNRMTYSGRDFIITYPSDWKVTQNLFSKTAVDIYNPRIKGEPYTDQPYERVIIESNPDSCKAHDWIFREFDSSNYKSVCFGSSQIFQIDATAYSSESKIIEDIIVDSLKPSKLSTN